MKIRVVIQARMGSTRLRGKTLSPVNGIPLLKRVYDAILKLKLTEDIVIATSNKQEDDPIEAYCTGFLSSKCLRGDTNNVLSRFVDACVGLNDNDAIVRITADNIFYQKEMCEQLVSIHKQHDNDYTGVEGLSHIVCELIKVSAIRSLENEQLSDYDKEHVTPYFIRNCDGFRTTFMSPKEFGLKKELDSLLTVDTEEDRNRIEKLIEVFENKNISYTQKNLYNWLNSKN